jgi:hypothetical protein
LLVPTSGRPMSSKRAVRDFPLCSHPKPLPPSCRPTPPLHRACCLLPPASSLARYQASYPAEETTALVPSTRPLKLHPPRNRIADPVPNPSPSFLALVPTVCDKKPHPKHIVFSRLRAHCSLLPTSPYLPHQRRPAPVQPPHTAARLSRPRAPHSLCDSFCLRFNCRRVGRLHPSLALNRQTTRSSASPTSGGTTHHDRRNNQPASGDQAQVGRHVLSPDYQLTGIT